MMKYAPRSESEDEKEHHWVCICGHFQFEHKFLHNNPIKNHGGCKKCMCPSNIKTAFLTFNQYTEISGSLSTPIDWDSEKGKKLKSILPKKNILKRLFVDYFVSDKLFQETFSEKCSS